MSTYGGYGYGTGGGGTTTYYAPYVPKGGPSRVWFHLLVDDALVVEPGDRVTLRGDLEELGSGGPGVPLAQSADEPNVWEAEVELPIGMTETHFRSAQKSNASPEQAARPRGPARLSLSVSLFLSLCLSLSLPCRSLPCRSLF